jgi:glycosyltransferase involved in cell wall biosynthesis
VRIAILAQYPVHLLSEARLIGQPSGHFATWLPQLHRAFKQVPEFDLHWISLSAHTSEYQRISDGNQTFHILPTAQSKRAATFFTRDRKRISEILSDISPSLVHGWGTEDVYALAAVTSGLPNIVSMQGILSCYVLCSKMHPRDYFQAIVELFVLFRADRITVESFWGEEVIHRRNPRANISLVEYGVAEDFFEITWRPEQNRPVAIFVGSIHPRKGIQDAVAAFSDPRLEHAELWVIGGDEGHWGSKLRGSAPSNVRWLGRLSARETAEKLSTAWCLVLPTRADTSPNAVKEARVIGLPVITTSCGGQSSYVRDGKNGFLTAPGDIGNLVAKLGVLLNDLEKCRTMGAFLNHEQREIFDPQATANQFASLYRQTLNAPASSFTPRK